MESRIHMVSLIRRGEQEHFYVFHAERIEELNQVLIAHADDPAYPLSIKEATQLSIMARNHVTPGAGIVPARGLSRPSERA